MIPGQASEHSAEPGRRVSGWAIITTRNLECLFKFKLWPTVLRAGRIWLRLIVAIIARDRDCRRSRAT